MIIHIMMSIVGARGWTSEEKSATESLCPVQCIQLGISESSAHGWLKGTGSRENISKLLTKKKSKSRPYWKGFSSSVRVFFSPHRSFAVQNYGNGGSNSSRVYILLKIFYLQIVYRVFRFLQGWSKFGRDYCYPCDSGIYKSDKPTQIRVCFS
jgi:hypothetical protein